MSFISVSLATLLIIGNLSQVFGQYTVCASNSDCSSLSGMTCMIPAGCKKGWCECPSSTPMLQNNKCTTAPTVTPLGSSCSSSATCGVGTQCSNGKCACLSVLTAMSDNTNCGTFAKGASCSTNQYCGTYSNYGSCSSGSCSCNSGDQWATGGDLGQPGSCVPNAAAINVGQGQPCTSPTTMNTDSAPKLCGANLNCGQCPEGGSMICMSGTVVTTAAMATVVLAALMAFFFGY